MAIASGMTSAITSPLHEEVMQAVLGANVMMAMTQTAPIGLVVFVLRQKMDQMKIAPEDRNVVAEDNFILTFDPSGSYSEIKEASHHIVLSLFQFRNQFV